MSHRLPRKESMANKERLPQPVAEEAKPSLAVLDAHKLDQRIPPGFIVMMKDEKSGRETPFVTKGGLLWKAEQMFGRGGYAVKAVPVGDEEYLRLRAREAVPEGQPCQIFRGEVWVAGFPEPFVDYGIAWKQNVLNSRLHNQLLHLAATRATNRALRMATACGLASYEEMASVDERAVNLETGEVLEGTSVVMSQSRDTDRQTAGITGAQLRAVFAHLKRIGMEEGALKERLGFTSLSRLTRREASQVIDWLTRQPGKEGEP